jgi:hypothetical protein
MGWSLNYEVCDWNENRNRMDCNIDRKDLHRDEIGSWDRGLECRGVNSNAGCVGHVEGVLVSQRPVIFCLGPLRL